MTREQKVTENEELTENDSSSEETHKTPQSLEKLDDVIENEDSYNSLDNAIEDEEISDDETVLEMEESNEKNDTLLKKDYLSSLLKQKDRLVYYEVENIYKNEDKRIYRSKYSLKKDPPVLIVRDEEENEVRFYLTENLTDELSDTLNQVKRAYYGFSGPSDMNMPKGFFSKLKYYVKNNPLKIIAGAVVIVFFANLFS